MEIGSTPILFFDNVGKAFICHAEERKTRKEREKGRWLLCLFYLTDEKKG
jgi:hypothetical protein